MVTRLPTFIERTTIIRNCSSILFQYPVINSALVLLVILFCASTCGFNEFSNMTVVKPIQLNSATLPTSWQKEFIHDSTNKSISPKQHITNPFLYKDIITSSYPIDNQPSIYFLSHVMIELYEKSGCKITAKLKKPLSHPLLAFPKIAINCLLSLNLNCLQDVFRAYSFPQSWIKLQDNIFQIHEQNYLIRRVTSLFQNFPDARIALLNEPEYVVIEHRSNKESDEIIYQRAIQCSFQFIGRY